MKFNYVTSIAGSLGIGLLAFFGKEAWRISKVHELRDKYAQVRNYEASYSALERIERSKIENPQDQKQREEESPILQIPSGSIEEGLKRNLEEMRTNPAINEYHELRNPDFRKDFVMGGLLFLAYSAAGCSIVYNLKRLERKQGAAK